MQLDHSKIERWTQALCLTGVGLLSVGCGGGGSNSTPTVEIDQPLSVSSAYSVHDDEALTVAPGELVTYQVGCGGNEGVVYEWDAGDGTMPSVTNENTFTHSYSKEGTYSPKVTCEGFRGASVVSTLVTKVFVKIPSHVLQKIQTETHPDATTTQVKFSADCLIDEPDTPNTGLSFAWDFGDGSSPVSGQTVTHVYSNSGEGGDADHREYTATVRCIRSGSSSTSSAGRVIKTSQTVQGKTKVVAGVATALPLITQGLTITRRYVRDGNTKLLNMACSSPDGMSIFYSFDFGDGTPKDVNFTGAAEHTYSGDGAANYTVNVECRPGGSVATQSQSLTTNTLSYPFPRRTPPIPPAS